MAVHKQEKRMAAWLGLAIVSHAWGAVQMIIIRADIMMIRTPALSAHRAARALLFSSLPPPIVSQVERVPYEQS